MPPHSLILTIVDASMYVWMDWFGFNTGSAVAADGVIRMAMLLTQFSTATAAIAWMVVEWIKHGKPSVLVIVIVIVTGAVAGLVAITPVSSSVGPIGAIVIGFAFGVHGLGGTVGCILTGIFVSEILRGQGLAEGMTMGKQVGAQLIIIMVTTVYCGVLSLIILKIVDVTVGLRVDESEEQEGLDLSLHGERGYDL